ncbi:MAG: XrtA system polysaccharide deacetylase [Candidatus Eisenbacteria bacterium]
MAGERAFGEVRDLGAQSGGRREAFRGDSTMTNALSVDVEDYFQVRSLASVVPLSTWENYERRFPASTKRLLELFSRFGAKCTFFVLGWNAVKEPGLVRDIVAAGHEIASHGWNHALVYEQSPREFREDVLRTKSVLEDISGARVAGYRAASYSVTSKSIWALDILAETGHLYDSSIYPIRRRVYGMPGERRDPHVKLTREGPLAEFPMPAVRLGLWNVPFASGAYLRAAPFWITERLLRSVNGGGAGRGEGGAKPAGRRGIPVVVNVHPWELDAGQPRLRSFLRRPNHYLCLGATEEKLARLLRSHSFKSVRTVLEELGLLERAG